MKASILVIKGLVQYAIAQGIDGQKIFDAGGIQAEDLENPTAYIPIKNFNKVWETVVELTSDPYYGLRCGDYFETNYGGPLAYLVESCADMREAIDQYLQFQSISGDFFEDKVRLTKQEAIVSYHPKVAWEAQSPTAVQCFLYGHFMIFLKVWSACINQKIYPKRVHLRAKRPTDVSILQEYFGAQLFFEQAEDALFFDLNLLDIPFIGHHPILKSTLQQHLKEALWQAENGQGFTEKIKYYLLESQVQGFKSISETAQYLQVSSRTLQRKLQAENTTFQQILDEVKLDMAKIYLKNGLSVKETAYKLFYTETTAFSKFFKKRMGWSPRQYCSVEDGE